LRSYFVADGGFISQFRRSPASRWPSAAEPKRTLCTARNSANDSCPTTAGPPSTRPPASIIKKCTSNGTRCLRNVANSSAPTTFPPFHDHVRCSSSACVSTGVEMERAQRGDFGGGGVATRDRDRASRTSPRVSAWERLKVVFIMRIGRLAFPIKSSNSSARPLRTASIKSSSQCEVKYWNGRFRRTPRP